MTWTGSFGRRWPPAGGRTDERRATTLSDLRITDAPEVGGKAASLGELMAEGVRVPDGVVLTVAGAQLPADERRALIEGGVGRLGDGTFAVRSSGVSEDGAERSFAGMYESALDVPVGGLAQAADRTLASAGGAHLASYAGAGNGTDAGVAVIVQRMVHAVAAGVALTADPITGDRETTLVTAVRGTGDRLVSGASVGDEWVVSRGIATSRRRTESAIDARQAIAVATEAVRIATERNRPQDVEWAIDPDGTLWILQARPMTALPPQVSWDPGAPGAFTRQLRLGEWIGAPVTPLFASWLLPGIEDCMHAMFQEMLGQRAPRPYHVIVNGWYFYSINFVSPAAMLRSLPGIISHLVREPRAVAGVLPATVRHSFPIMERWRRTEVQPRYRALVGEDEGRVETLEIEALPGLVDGLADAAGEYFTSIAALAGAAYKMEMNLAGFYQAHLMPTLGGSHLPLVAGIAPPAAPSSHAVSSLELVVRTTRQRTRRLAADDGSRCAGAAARGCRGSRRGSPGLVTSPAPQVQAAADRQPAPRPDPRGADSRADAGLAGHAARRAANRSGTDQQRRARRSGRRVLPHAGGGLGRAGQSGGVHGAGHCRAPSHS